MIKTIILPDLPSMQVFAKDVAEIFRSVPLQRGAYLTTLSGELGAGKTTFVQFFAKEFGVSETVQSPTFVLAKSYQTTVVWPKRLLHIDAYRLAGFDDLRPLDWEREIADKDTLILLEWPECVAPLSPTTDLAITFSVEPNGGRLANLAPGSNGIMGQ